jgi:hypothetical protein
MDAATLVICCILAALYFLLAAYSFSQFIYASIQMDGKLTVE